MNRSFGSPCNDFKTYRWGTQRTVAPSATLARILPYARPMGITRVANVTGLDQIGLPVVMVSRPNSRSLAVAQGKGLDLVAAKVSGLMEAMESYHAETITAPLKYASYRELRDTDHTLIDVEGLPRSRYARYHEQLRLSWIEGYDLINDKTLWLPFESVSTDYTLPLFPGSGCFAATTNGLASGNNRPEAICHGLCEVIERDATALWHLREDTDKQQTVLDLDSVRDPLCRQVLDIYEQAGMAVLVWDVTTDVGVAAFYCLVMERDSATAQPECGAGCHPLREVALLRALTEAAQVRTTYIAGSRDDLDPEQYEAEATAQRVRVCQRYLDQYRPVRDFEAVPSFAVDTFREDLDWLLARLCAVGITQTAVVDLSKPAFDLSVVRVIVPGLEGPYKGEHSDYLPGPRARALAAGEGA